MEHYKQNPMTKTNNSDQHLLQLGFTKFNQSPEVTEITVARSRTTNYFLVTCE